MNLLFLLSVLFLLHWIVQIFQITQFIYLKTAQSKLPAHSVWLQDEIASVRRSFH